MLTQAHASAICSAQFMFIGTGSHIQTIICSEDFTFLKKKIVIDWVKENFTCILTT